mgnify:CR=1 FL=1
MNSKSQKTEFPSKETILKKLKTVIDPETGADVVRMRLIEELEINQKGHVKYTFKPSSPVCPLAVHLVEEIKQAIAQVPGVTSQKITVKGYINAEQLTTLINQ